MDNLIRLTGRRNPTPAPAIDPQSLPYSARLISRRYSCHPRMALVVAQLVGYAIKEAEARR